MSKHSNDNKDSEINTNHHYTIFEKIINFIHSRPFKSRVRIISITAMILIALVIVAIFSLISYNRPAEKRANDNITELPITSETESLNTNN